MHVLWVHAHTHMYVGMYSAQASLAAFVYTPNSCQHFGVL